MTGELAQLRATTRTQYLAGLRDAWKSPAQRAMDSGGTPHRDAAEPDLSSPPEVMRRHLRTEEAGEAQARRDRAWGQYRDRLANAWRGRADPHEADRIEAEGERWRHGR
jgi:hypothetical protein